MRGLILFVVMVTVALLALPTGSVAAEESTGDCKVCESLIGGGGGITGPTNHNGHEFSGQLCSGGHYGNLWCRDCHVFNSCHDNNQPGDCDDFHWACGTTIGMVEAVDGVDLRDADEVLAATYQYPGGVRILAIGYLALVDCEGAIVGARRLTESTIRAVSALADSRGGGALHPIGPLTDAKTEGVPLG